ncbi:MAG: dephospho-CoA kinase [Bacteroidales bacterium]|nr:dephospho-CoA kinase [Bacteroidales bacterium]MCF8404670.1 dephospho-CoA kinase [Bacteroidales bacterium]
MIKVGLTGNIGSGKSTVAKVFETLGVPVFHADIRAKKFLEEKDVMKELVRHFGKDVINQGGIDRKNLAKIVFNDLEAISTLNSIIHPLVRKDLFEWIEMKKDHEYVIQEAAILFESGFYEFFDKIILVTCPEKIATERVMNRDKISQADVMARMKNQWPEEKKIPMSDHIVHNDGQNLIIPQVLEIHKQLIK